MPYRQKNPKVIEQRRITTHVAFHHEMPHEAGLTELPPTNTPPMQLDQIPRVGDVTVSFRKIQTQIPRS